MLVAAGIAFVVGMAIDVVAADGHPDWGYIIVKNLVLAAISAGTSFGVSSWVLHAGYPAWFATIVGRVASGTLVALADQGFYNYETGNSGGYLDAGTRGLWFGTVSGVLGSKGTDQTAVALVTRAVETLFVRAIPVNGWAPHEKPLRLDLPPRARHHPPMCGRDDRGTMPSPCDLVGP